MNHRAATTARIIALVVSLVLLPAWPSPAAGPDSWPWNDPTPPH